MRSRSWLRTNRRGYSILEVTVAAAILLLIATGTLSVLNTAARLEQARDATATARDWPTA